MTQWLSHNKMAEKHTQVERIFEHKPEQRWKLRWLECIKNEFCAMEDKTTVVQSYCREGF
jgi:hypothetical protein